MVRTEYAVLRDLPCEAFDAVYLKMVSDVVLEIPPPIFYKGTCFMLLRGLWIMSICSTFWFPPFSMLTSIRKC